MAEITVQQAIDVLFKQFPIQFENIKGTEKLVTTEDLKTVLELTSPDGTIWAPAIDNDGKVTWSKKEATA